MSGNPLNIPISIKPRTKTMFHITERPQPCGQLVVSSAPKTSRPWLTKPKRRTIPRVESDIVTSRLARRLSERRLEIEYIKSTLYGVCRMAEPQLVPMDVRSSCSSAFPTDIYEYLFADVPLSIKAREYISLSFASAQAFEYSQRVASNADHSLLGSVAEQWICSPSSRASMSIYLIQAISNTLQPRRHEHLIKP